MAEPIVCCFTGHRKIVPEDLGRLPPLLDHTLERLIEAGVTVFRAGGAMGFDTLAALAVLQKREVYRDIRLELILPCKNQTKNWNERHRSVYDYVLARADSVTFLHERYTNGCMHERNRRLVDGSLWCVAFCGAEEGGSAYTVAYARRKGVSVINLMELIR